MSRQYIFDEIETERNYQNDKWGSAFDDKNTTNDWTAYVNLHLAKANVMSASEEEQRKQWLKVASLAVAALETFDRNGGFALRHYDDFSNKN